MRIFEWTLIGHVENLTEHALAVGHLIEQIINWFPRFRTIEQLTKPTQQLISQYGTTQLDNRTQNTTLYASSKRLKECRTHCSIACNRNPATIQAAPRRCTYWSPETMWCDIVALVLFSSADWTVERRVVALKTREESEWTSSNRVVTSFRLDERSASTATSRVAVWYSNDTRAPPVHGEVSIGNGMSAWNTTET